MPTWDEVLAREVSCQRCKGTFCVRGPIAGSDLAEIRQMLERGQRISAIRAIREKTGAGLRDAKGMFEHITIDRGKCHQCCSALPEGLLTDCEGCGAFNIDA